MRHAKFVASGLVLFAACSSAAQSSKQPAPSDVIATVGSTQITLAEVDERALQQSASEFGSAKLSQALYSARRAALDEIVANKLFDDAAWVGWRLAELLPVSDEQRLGLLQQDDPHRRLDRLLEWMDEEA